jgi:hypothetical protein
MAEIVVVNEETNSVIVQETINSINVASPGPQGPRGLQGIQGFGYAQLQGTQGVQGLQGPQGTQGTQGTQGVQGNQGVQGVQGTQGTQGVQGVQGTQGVQGNQGVQGVQGLLGTQGTQGVQGTQGTQGLLGIQGSEGSFGGATFDYTFNTDTTNSDPGIGKIAFNANPTTATAMYIDSSNDGATNISTFLNTIDDSSSTIKGHFRISQKFNPNIFKLYTITSITDNTGWFTVNCSYVSGNGNLLNLDDVLITFARTGDKGDTGVQGAQGLQGIQGTQGVQGLQGNQGTQGVQGVQGTQGVQGVQGTQGIQGLQGTQGNQGLQGVLGIQGTQGTQGILGDKGIVAQISAPTNTDVLWLDTDEPAVTPANISVTYPVINTGTTENAVISVLSGSTSASGVLQLTDSVSSTSTTTAATPNAVKTSYDLAVIKNPIIKMISGAYYKTGLTSTGAITITHQRTYYSPIYIPETTTLDRLAIRTTATFNGPATIRLGIYNNTNGQPSTVVLDAGTLSATAASTSYEITISQSLAPGFYWLAMCQQGTAPANSDYLGNAVAINAANLFIGLASVSPNGNIYVGYTQASVTGAFATATSLLSVNTLAYTFVRVA